MVEQFLADNSTDILYQHASDVKWVPYNKFHFGDYPKVLNKMGDMGNRESFSEVFTKLSQSTSSENGLSFLTRWSNESAEAGSRAL